VRCEALAAPADGDGGVRLHVDGAASAWSAGDHAWRELVCTFAVDGYQRAVELECQLRANGGRAWLRADSLQLVRVP
jgi:hypothetical protein